MPAPSPNALAARARAAELVQLNDDSRVIDHEIIIRQIKNEFGVSLSVARSAVALAARRKRWETGHLVTIRMPRPYYLIAESIDPNNISNAIRLALEYWNQNH